MKPGPFTYHDPTTVAETIDLLGRFEGAKLLAGGQSLMPMLNYRYALPEHVVDLNRVVGLDKLSDTTGPDGNNGIMIGAMVRQRTLERSDLLAHRCPLLLEALAHVGHFQTRN